MAQFRFDVEESVVNVRTQGHATIQRSMIAGRMYFRCIDRWNTSRWYPSEEALVKDYPELKK